MCGICGIVWAKLHPVSSDLITRMMDVLIHRGPDDSGHYFEPGVALGFRRLAIIDLNTGSQPMQTADGDLTIVFNGEIYNFQEIRQQLETRGHRFRTRSDTEVILYAYREYGLDCFTHFDGMFAIGLWDRRQRRLVLGRDRLGKKPLFYHVSDNPSDQNGSALLFASELKSLLQNKHIPRDLDYDALDRFLTYRYTLGEDCTVLKHIRQLPPAHFLVYSPSDGRIDIRRYWSPADGLRDTPSTMEELDALIRAAVRKRLISDVPLGAFLSGGLDSSVVVALIAAVSDQPVKTFSIGFGIEEYNELPYARQVAERYGTDHHEYMVQPDVTGVLDDLVWNLDEPFGDASALPTYYVARMARHDVTVVLNGDGGDESFAGYKHYKSMLRASLYFRLPASLRHKLIEPVMKRVPVRDLAQRFGRLLRHYDQPFPARFAQRMTLMSLEQRLRLYRASFVEQLTDTTSNHLAARFVTTHNGHSELTQMLLIDLTTVLPGDLLVKMDRMSMANSLEARSPFLDHHVVEAALNLPDHLRTTWRGPNKIILRKLYGHLLPKELLTRPKSGFSVPVANWFRGPLCEMVRDILLSSQARQRPFFEPDAVQALIASHQSGAVDAGHTLWTMMMLELWLRMYIDAAQVSR